MCKTWKTQQIYPTTNHPSFSVLHPSLSYLTRWWCQSSSRVREDKWKLIKLYFLSSCHQHYQSWTSWRWSAFWLNWRACARRRCGRPLRLRKAWASSTTRTWCVTSAARQRGRTATRWCSVTSATSVSIRSGIKGLRGSSLCTNIRVIVHAFLKYSSSFKSRLFRDKIKLFSSKLHYVWYSYFSPSDLIY